MDQRIKSDMSMEEIIQQKMVERDQANRGRAEYELLNGNGKTEQLGVIEARKYGAAR